jgi:hypothetical protein
MKKVELTLQEIWAATRPSVRKNKKKYTRKGKGKKLIAKESNDSERTTP